MQDLDMLGAQSAVGLETMDILKTLPGVLQAAGQGLSAQALTMKKPDEKKEPAKEPSKDGGASKPAAPPAAPPTASSLLASMPLPVKVGGGVALALVAWRLLRSKG